MLKRFSYSLIALCCFSSSYANAKVCIPDPPFSILSKSIAEGAGESEKQPPNIMYDSWGADIYDHVTYSYSQELGEEITGIHIDSMDLAKQISKVQSRFNAILTFETSDGGSVLSEFSESTPFKDIPVKSHQEEGITYVDDIPIPEYPDFSTWTPLLQKYSKEEIKSSIALQIKKGRMSDAWLNPEKWTTKTGIDVGAQEFLIYLNNGKIISFKLIYPYEGN